MRSAVLSLILVFTWGGHCNAGLSPRQLSEVSFSPSAGAVLPLDEGFVSAGGKRLTLGDAIGGRPTALVLVAYSCRFICGTTLAIAAAGLSATGLEAGKDFSFVVIGINPKDTLADAKAMEAANLAPYPKLIESAEFLNGDAAAIGRVAHALGYTPVYDTERDEFAHPVGVVVLTGDGRVSSVLGGLNLQGSKLKAALTDAQQNKLSALAEGIRLLCYGHDPLHGPYSTIIQYVLAGFGLATIAALAAMFSYLLRQKGLQS